MQLPAGAEPNLCRDLVSDEPEQSGRRQEPKVRQRARVDEALDGLPERHERTDENCQHHRQPRPPLAACTAQEEGDAERNRRQRVAEVVDQVGQERDAQRLRIDERLR